MSKVKHAVILMAGKGTRFLPATKAMAKELFPVGNKPALLYHLQECLESGIEEVTIVISKQKKDVIKFLKPDKKLEELIKGTSKEKLLEEWKRIVTGLKINFVYQGKMNGSGGAVYSTRKFTKGQPFIVIFGDDVIIPKDGGQHATKQLIDIHEKTGKYVMGALKVSDDVVDRYGMAVPGERVDDKVLHIHGFVEKPKKGEQPSNLATMARYVVTPEVYDNILKLDKKDNSEVHLPQAVMLEADKNKVLACEFDATYHDLGNKLEFIKCTIAEGLKDPSIGKDLKEYLKNIEL